MKKTTILLCLLLYFMGAGVSAQSGDSTALNLQLIGKSNGNKVILRWAPTTPGGWSMSLAKGYIIERAEIDDNGIFNPEKFRSLTDQPIRPWPLEAWEKICVGPDAEHYAPIAAQSIYGKEFMTTQPVNRENELLAQADEFSNRHSICLLAADMSGVTAEASGLRYVDENTEVGRTYVYRLFSKVDPELYHIDTAYFVINTDEVSPEPQIEFEVQELEKVVNLQWDRNLNDMFYTAYYVERSDNGKDFYRLTEYPYISSPAHDNPEKFDLHIYPDSVAQNYIKRYYRIRGITAFGDIGEPSEVKEAMGRDRTPPAAPINVTTKHLGGNQMKITWEMLPGTEDDVYGFMLAHSHAVLDSFIPIHDEPLSKNTRSFIHNGANSESTNYYVVASADSSGNAAVSLSSYGMILDSIPPASPSGLTADVDSLGHVKLKWNLGPEKDIIGYQVYFANAAEHVLTQVTGRPWKDTIYIDTISLNTLTRHVYYSVIAVDANYNYSKFSDTLELTRPDTIAPSPSILSEYIVEDGHILIKWAVSSSTDLDRQILYRRREFGNWEQVAVFANRERQYQDYTIKKEQVYFYRIEAIDEAGLSSGFVNSLRIKAIDFNLKPGVQDLDVAEIKSKKGEIPKMDLSWSYPIKGNYRFEVYRAVNDGPFLTLMRTSFKYVTDDEIKPGNSYEYAVKVKYPDGKQSEFVQSEKVVLGER